MGVWVLVYPVLTSHVRALHLKELHLLRCSVYIIDRCMSEVSLERGEIWTCESSLGAMWMGEKRCGDMKRVV